MEKFVRDDKVVRKALASGPHGWVLSPNTQPVGAGDASASRAHGGFDDDQATVKATLARVLGTESAAKSAQFSFERSGSSLKDRRRSAEKQVSGA